MKNAFKRTVSALLILALSLGGLNLSAFAQVSMVGTSDVSIANFIDDDFFFTPIDEIRSPEAVTVDIVPDEVYEVPTDIVFGDDAFSLDDYIPIQATGFAFGDEGRTITAGESYYYDLGDDNLIDFHQEYYQGTPTLCYTLDVLPFSDRQLDFADDYAIGDTSYYASNYIGITPLSTVVTFVYRGNGHTGGIVPASHSLTTPGTTALRQPGNMVRAGHIFAGWRDGGGNVFAAGQSVGFSTAVSGTVTLDAHWVPAVVTVTYFGNGHTSGVVPAGHTINTPGSFVVREPGTMARTGHVFYAWRMSNGNIADPGAIINVTGSGTIRFDAIWIPSVVTFHYVGNGHTGGTVPVSHSLTTPGTATLRQPGNMVRAGHTFVGWRDQRNVLMAAGSNIIFQNAVAGSVTLTAYWRVSSVTVTYNGNGHTSGTVPLGHTINTPGSFTVRAPGNLARTGYVFDGWRHIESNNVFWPGDIITVTGAGTMRLDALWRRSTGVGADIVWLEASQFHTDIEKFISSTRLPEFGSHRNVTVAVIRQHGLSGGSSFVLLGETWHYAGPVNIVFGTTPNAAYIPIIRVNLCQ